ncbi:MAG: hypothetical protein NZ561_07705 [Phycisphaerae bacterium]|nr:hypothetical protein [Phycisphaerae bacterium]
MASDTTNPSPAEPPGSAPVARRRRWPRRLAVALGLSVLLLFGLVAAAPMLAGSRLGRSLLVKQANRQLDGSIQIEETSFAWFNGQRMAGVKLFDAQQSLILEIERLETGLTLASLLRGTLDFGPTVIDVNLARLQVDPDGNTNLQHTIRRAFAQSRAARGSAAAPPEATSWRPPKLSGKVTLRYRGTLEYVDRLGGRLLSPPLVIEPGQAVVDVSDLNSAIDHAITLSLRLGDRPAGKVELAGTLKLFEDDQFNLAKLSADQRIKLSGVDFSALTPLLRIFRLDGEYTGLLNGELGLKAEGAARASADGLITIDDASIAGLTQLAGQRLKIGTVSVPVRISRRTQADGSTQLKIDSLRVDTPQFMVVIAAELDEQSLRNVVEGRQPGADGWLSTTVAVRDGASLLNQIPRAVGLVDGVHLSEAMFSQTMDITLRRDKIFAKGRMDLRAAGKQNGRAIVLAPVGLSLDGTYTPNVEPLQGFRDVALVLTSDFANARGGGVTLDQLEFAGEGDLGRLRSQLAQFIDLGSLNLAGTFKFAGNTQGELGKPDSRIDTRLNVELQGLNVSLPARPPLVVGRLDLSAEAAWATDSRGAISRISQSRLALGSGQSATGKVLDLAAEASGVNLRTADIERFELTNLAITDLPGLVRQWESFFPTLREEGIEIVDGQVYASAAGSFDAKSKTIVLSRPLAVSTPNLTVLRGGKTVLNRERITAEVLGRIGLADGVGIDLSRLSLNSSMIRLAKSEPPFTARFDESGALTGSGRLSVSAELPKVSAALMAFGATPAQTRSGTLEATIDLTGGIGTESRLTLDGMIQGLSVATAAGEAMTDERLQIRAGLLTSADLSSLSANATVESSFARFNLPRAQLRLATAAQPVGRYEAIQSLAAELIVPDLPKLHALVSAFLPDSEGTSMDRSTARFDPRGNPRSVEPLLVTSGGASLKLEVLRDGAITRVAVPECRISKLRLSRGEQHFAFDRNTPISLRLAAEVDAVGDQLRSVKVTDLAGDLRVASLAMPAAITITDLQTHPRASGTVEVTGRLEEAAPLLAMVQGGDVLPYGGGVRLRQQLTNSGRLVQLVGSLEIDDFSVREAESGTRRLIEKRIVVRNDLTADLQSASARIRDLSIDMPQSRAVSLKLAGQVNDWSSRRELQSITIELGYDLERLWPLLEPMLGAQLRETLAGARVAGAYTEKFTIGGSFPDRPFAEAIRSVSAQGQLRADLVDVAGLTIERLVIPVSLREGKASIAWLDRPREHRLPPPAMCNGGTLNLGGLVVDLSGDEPRLSAPRRHRLLQNVSINPVLGDTIGKYVNPIFANAQRSRGLLDVTLERCEGVALGQKWASPESGSARVAFSITELDIVNPLGGLMLGKIAGLVNLGGLGRGETDVFRGEIRDAIVTLDAGRTRQELTITLREDIETTDPATGVTRRVPREMPLTFQGDIRLSDLRQQLRVSLPGPLVGRFIRVSERDMARFFPEGVPISLVGTTTRPEVDLGNLAQRLIEAQIRRSIGAEGQSDPIGQIGDIIESLRGRSEERDRRDRNERPRSP